MTFPRLCLVFLLLTACKGKDKAPAQDDPARPGSSSTTLPGDCAKAQAEMERLDRCGEPDLELAELHKEIKASLADPNVPPDVKALVVEGCRRIVSQASGMSCDNIASRRRRQAPPRLTAECEKAKALSERLAKCEKLDAEEREAARTRWEESKEEILSAAKVLAESDTDPEIRSAATELLHNNCTKILADLAVAADTCP